MNMNNHSHTHILFDLDGTLSDPAEGILNAIMYAVEKLGLEEKMPHELTSFIGPPIINSFSSRYGLSPDEAKNAVAIYREYYSRRGKFENHLYPGIVDMLKELHARSIPLYVATAKPEGFSREILDHFEISRYFTGLVGATLDHSRSEKEDIISLLLESYCLDPGNCLMVGDRRFDMQGARACGVEAIGVLYGHGSHEELEAETPLALARSVDELLGILLSYCSTAPGAGTAW